MLRLGVGPGAFSFSRAASLMYESQGKTLMDVCAKRSICPRAAATTLGWEWPTFITPMPPAKSMNSRPSVSVMMAFLALPMSEVVALATPRGSALGPQPVHLGAVQIGTHWTGSFTGSLTVAGSPAAGSSMTLQPSLSSLSSFASSAARCGGAISSSTA